jgi:hypothetical protein
MSHSSPFAARRLVYAASLALLLAACGKKEEEKPKPQEVILNVTTVDLQGKPVEMVRFYINGKKFGITDQEGKFRGRFPAKDGETLSFNVEAPQGYSVPPNVDQSRWQVKIKYPEDGRPLQVDFKATLQRPERDYLFMVRTADPATPVKVNGELVGKTGPTGDALLRVGGVPGTHFSARAGNITYQGTFAEDDEVYLLTDKKAGPIGGDKKGETAQAAPPSEPTPPSEAAAPPTAAAPESVAAVAHEEPAHPTPPEPVVAPVVAQHPTPAPAAHDEDPWAAPPAPVAHAQERPAHTEPRVVAPKAQEPEPIAAQEPEPAPVVSHHDEPAPPALGLLDDTPAPAPATAAPSRPAAAQPTAAPDGLLAEGGGTVDRNAAAQAKPVASAGGPSAVGMSREEVQSRLDQIKSGLDRSKVLQRADVEFLSQIDSTHPGYYEAHRLLGDFYFQLKDYKRTSEELEIATSRGRYKHDPTLLLALAKSYAQQNDYRRALSVMTRVEVNMRDLPANQKADAFRFYAEMYEFEFLRQYHDDAKKANATLLDKALQQWEHYKTFAQGADPQGVALADSKIKKLQELKSGLEL